jgi:hypothetical protein
MMIKCKKVLTSPPQGFHKLIEKRSKGKKLEEKGEPSTSQPKNGNLKLRKDDESNCHILSKIIIEQRCCYVCKFIQLLSHIILSHHFISYIFIYFYLNSKLV